jgi:threonine/homoserine/homoserine lactone efflux protein
MTTAVVTFLLAGGVLVILPGPDSMLMLRAITVHGRATALRTAAGSLTGLVVWAVSASIGLAALLKASDVGYTVLRLVGAAYLLTLGVQALRRRSAAPPKVGGFLGAGYLAGLATNLFNPKVGVFFVTFLPGFVPGGVPVGPTSLLFGGLYVVETALYFAVMLLLVDRLARALRDDVVRRRIERLSGCVLIVFGLRLATES